MKQIVWLLGLGLVLLGCGGGTPLPTNTGTLRVTSPAFADGESIPQKFTCSGENISPALEWSNAPTGTKSFALIVDDPDAPGGTFTHWVAYDIPASQTNIAEGANAAGVGGKNSGGTSRYMGPCPPLGEHRYVFVLYALDVDSLGLGPDATKTQLVTAMQGHILAQATLMGRYKK
jgi:Raf kinase inhibitor-like YbhB/YbcL family protein